MAKDQPLSVKEAVFKLQLSLLEGIQNEDQLFAAGSLMSRSDYEDVVTERSIANICGYPLCCNRLPSDRPRKGRYRISLVEHKVYDLHETYMYCSSSCVVNSKAFTGSLQDKRCSVLNPEKLNEALRLFGNTSLEPEKKLGKPEELGLSGMTIQEKTETSTADVSLEQWIGPSNAIEGYVPKQRHSDSKGSSQKNFNKGPKARYGRLSGRKSLVINEMDFMSTIITQDEYSVSKMPLSQTETNSDFEIKPTTEKLKLSKRVRNEIVEQDDHGIQEPSSSFQSDLNINLSKAEKGTKVEELVKSSKDMLNSSMKPSGEKGVKHCVSISERQSDAEKNESNDAYASNLDAANSVDISEVEKEPRFSKNKPKSSLKTSGKKKLSRSVTWADEKIDRSGSKSLCEVRETGNTKKESELEGNTGAADDELDLRRATAEACAVALSQASEAVASGESDVTDAVSEAGIIIFPSQHDVGEEGTVEDDTLEKDSVTLKWPRKPGVPDIDSFDSEDSWYDPPPEGFSLTLSPFATMWNALFSWITSSSLAYIYGSDESFHEEYLSVNGREYPRQIILEDGRSIEIKQTLASCLARALPEIVAELRLPIPISTLEKGMARFLDTMSFMDTLPALRMRQWQVVGLVFIDALSVCRIPALISYMTDRRVLFHKVLDNTHISMEEYEFLKDLIIPLGRVPHFSAQSGA
ncbi:putative RNA polymerase II subunit B1 CTD phosphatase RPAP2-like protein [Senna tora]|uniref:RNA polymerase II subunit B1 CTD phosphatase RPAP2 homolog n=1 Tax=Senna tora TaxID=362788 RepID=A0A834WRF9_9FABA|nr:putative RNA polymerase II subunit B1 CTD phosphatase RPAP2-like protein [Senna tora]